MAAWIHGWRVFSFGYCEKVEASIIQGAMGMHLHSRVQKAAECRGITSAMWMTETARERVQARAVGEGSAVPHEGPAPDWDCSCGSYFYRTFKDAWISDSQVYAHITCLERTMLHKNGGRTTQYSVDYLLAPSKAGAQVYVPSAGGMSAVSANPWGWITGEERDYDPLLAEVAASLEVPIYERNDLRGCPECLLVNGWREEKEVTNDMRREWFGEGYKRHEVDTKRRMGEVD